MDDLEDPVLVLDQPDRIDPELGEDGLPLLPHGVAVGGFVSAMGIAPGVRGIVKDAIQ